MMMEQVFQQLTTNLSPDELRRLDKFITPEVGALLIKGLPELEPIIRPFMEADMGPTMPGGTAPQTGAPMPQPTAVAPGMPGGGPAAMSDEAPVGKPRFLTQQPRSALNQQGFGR